MRDPIQILLVLDLATDNLIPLDEVLARIPDKRSERIILRLTDFGARPAARGSSETWNEWADAVLRMLEKARSHAKHDGPSVHFYVAGRAGLPVFAHLGMELSKWAAITLINQRPDHIWVKLPLQAPSAQPASEPFFKSVRGLKPDEPSDASGRVAVFITTGHPFKKSDIQAFFHAQPGDLAGIVEIAPGGEGTTWLDEAHAPTAAAELVELFPRIRASYPDLSGVALFIAGPAPLAFMVGRALNPHIIADAWVPNFKVEDGAYRFALGLPHKGRSQPELRETADDELARNKVLNVMVDGIEALRTTLQVDHLAPLLSFADKAQFVQRLKDLKIEREPQGDAFDLSVAEERLVLGRGFLEVLWLLPRDEQIRIGQGLLLHELFHFGQNLQSSTYTGIGRAGFALEEVDYWADTFALATLVGWEIRRGGVAAEERVREIATAHIDAALRGIEAFDRAEQDDRLERLYERRLRRYLIWHLQRARALSIKSADQVWKILGQRLIVELAPIEGYLDDRSDKVVKAALPTTEIVVVLQGRLLRTPHQPSIDPGALVEAVRTFNRNALYKAMQTVRDLHLAILGPGER
jgi:SMODS-associated and fused to various effectors sensor domain